MKYLTRLSLGEWKEGDVLLFQRPPKGGTPFDDTICEVKGGVLVEIPSNEIVTPEPHWECDRINHRFVSDGTWYVEGTEAYPTHEIDDEWGSAVFKGWTNEEYDGCTEELPRWDGELCQLEEFVVTERKM